MVYPRGIRGRTATALALVGFALVGCDDDDGTGPDDLSDAEVVAVAMALNTGEIVTSEPALTRAVDAQVIDFAEQMIADHTAANATLQALGITPAPNPLSQQLTQTATQLVATLSQLTGEPFDEAYMEAQVMLHRTALETIEDELVPEADAAPLRAQLQLMRTAVTAHLDLAEQIEETVD